ncbi:MAG: hypothetical protein ACPGUV_03340 [Polyangiales bacterium]
MRLRILDGHGRVRFLANIQTEVARLDRLVSRLLKLSRIEASEAPFEALPLRTVLSELVRR